MNGKFTFDVIVCYGKSYNFFDGISSPKNILSRIFLHIFKSIKISVPKTESEILGQHKCPVSNSVFFDGVCHILFL